ncbi:MAG: DUF1800 domain-containing protein [Pseudomonadales bacterium]
MQKQDLEVAIAVNRYGLGSRPGEWQAAKRDPKQWLLDQMVSPQFDPAVGNLDMAYDALAVSRDMKKQKKQMLAQGMEAEKGKNDPTKGLQRNLIRDGFERSLMTEQPFSMRMFDFFSNHFSITTGGNVLGAVGPLLEREAIAPNLFGRFEHMLLAVEQHPAMLVYLNNEKSIGPHSRMGKKKGGGLNENLAREILELHTLGVDGGYDLDDIQQLAMAISGWSVSRGRDKEPQQGFIFRQYGHEPGKREILGTSYSQQGVKQGQAVLRDLAKHPSTARFISQKMVRYFISDEPSSDLVDAMENTWMQTGGNIKAVTTTMLGHEDAWAPTLEKFKTPREFVISCLRACDVTPGSRKTARFNKQFVGTLSAMGQAPFKAGSPAGYSSDNESWTGADALMKRIDWVSQLTDRVKRDPIKVAQQTLGDSLSETTRLAVSRAESRQQGLALLLLSPEFQRR